MPKTTKSGKPRQSELPSTLQRSDAKAQRTFAKAHDSAAEEYGEGRRAHQTAYSALKHSYEKVGDHWERTGGVDANAPKTELYDIAKRLDIGGRSKMNKGELVDAIRKANDRKIRSARR